MFEEQIHRVRPGEDSPGLTVCRGEDGKSEGMAVFCVSARAEMQFLLFSIFPPRRKRCFYQFLIFRPGGNVPFCIFHSSSVDERRFLDDSAFRRPTTDSFCRFLRFVGRRRAVFAVFFVSSADDGRFSGHFCFSKGVETQKLSVFDFPRGWKRGFFRFPIKNRDFSAPDG